MRAINGSSIFVLAFLATLAASCGDDDGDEGVGGDAGTDTDADTDSDSDTDSDTDTGTDTVADTETDSDTVPDLEPGFEEGLVDCGGCSDVFIYCTDWIGPGEVELTFYAGSHPALDMYESSADSTYVEYDLPHPTVQLHVRLGLNLAESECTDDGGIDTEWRTYSPVEGTAALWLVATSDDWAGEDVVPADATLELTGVVFVPDDGIGDPVTMPYFYAEGISVGTTTMG